MIIPFEKYHAENPHIWNAFKKLTFEAIEKGFTNYSANGIFEVMRWHTKEEGNDGYKVNNIYRPDYARKFMLEFPSYAGFFRTRELKAKRK